MAENSQSWPARVRARYAPLRRLGAGGMGEVWAAHDRLLDRDVALKVLRPDRRPDEARLQEEFALLASLDHPGVVHVLDTGVSEGVVYMTAELVEGLRLDRYLETEPRADEVVGVVWDILEVLAWLHREGVVHADIKPANILLETTERPTPVLIDFGLARVRGGGAVPLGGTLTYMAPELKRGRWARPAPRTDLYALGVSLRPWAETNPSHPLAALVTRLASEDPAHRPVNADEALADPAFASVATELPRRLGGRGLTALWGDTVSSLSEALCGAPGLHLVEVPAEDDADALLTDLAAALEIGGQPTLRLAADQVDGAGVTLWDRVVAAMTGRDEALPEADILAPEDHKEVLDARAVDFIDALRGGEHPALLVPNPSRLTDPGRYILARLVEAGVFSRVVATIPRGRTLSMGRGVETSFQTTVVSSPSPEALHHFLVDHGLPMTASDTAIRLLTARAAAGARALRLLLRAWATAGAIRYDAVEGWSWDPTVDVSNLDIPDLGELWTRLWEALPDSARALITHTLHLGGQVPIERLGDLAGGPFDRAIQARLVEEGWCKGAADALRLQPSAHAALEVGDIALTPLDDAQRRAYVTLLGDDPAAPTGLTALAGHLTALGEHTIAAERWEALGTHHDHHLDPGAAGDALSRAAACHDADGAPERAFQRADQAVRLLQVAGDEEGLARALALSASAANAVGTDGVALRQALLEARVAVHGTRPDEAMAAADRAEALLTSLGDATDDQARFDLALARGTAHAQAGRGVAAVEHLGRAAEIAADRGDDHGEGRVTNNLGIAAYNERDYAAAAEAWARSAAAKLRTGDVRGHRISESNRGLALRELGRIPEAIEAARSSLQDARRIGDRRGEATGCLALAQLHLDVGDAVGAAVHVEAATSVPVDSAMVRADTRIVGLRQLLASGDAVESAISGARLTRDANEAGLPTVAREAWGLTYLANTRGLLRKEEAGDVYEVLTDDPVGALLELGVEGDPLLHAAWLHATACTGDWPTVRPALSKAANALSAPLAPGEFSALGLLEATAELVGDEIARGAIAEATVVTLRARREAARTVLGERAPDPQTMALAFGVTVDDDAVSESGPLAFEDTILSPDSDPASATTASVLQIALKADFSDPSRLCDAIRDHVDASAADLVMLDAARRPVDLDGAETSARWSSVAADVLVGGQQYVAMAEEQTIAAMGLPLRVTADSEPVGALFLSWREPLDGDADQITSVLSRTVELLALSVDRRVKTRETETLRGRMLRLQQEHDSLVRAHRDQVTALREALDQSRSEHSLRFDYSHIIHRSREMQKVLRIVDKVSDRDIPVLILGESGVGKEVIARAIHTHGERAAGPFVAENCGAVPDELVESVFFGHVRGAFTGADTAREGLVAAADGGTLFLDELGELPLKHQVKLLRVLQERRYRPVGATEEREANFRLVAATNRDLQAQVAEGTFREDLYYRLAVVEVPIPPLRERPDDIVPLAHHLLSEHNRRLGRALKLSTQAANTLVRHRWPGNVRELDNELLRAAVLCDGDHIRTTHLSPAVTGTAEVSTGASLGELWDGEEALSDVVGRVEHAVIERALKHSRGQKAKTARLLALSRPGLDGKIQRYGIDAAEIRASARRKPSKAD